MNERLLLPSFEIISFLLNVLPTPTTPGIYHKKSSKEWKLVKAKVFIENISSF